MTAKAHMPAIYFDITDLVDYLQGNHHVTGIQRVQLRILAAMIRDVTPDVHCVAYCHQARRYKVYPAKEIFGCDNTPPEKVLRQLPPGKHNRLLDQAAVRRALQPYNHRKVYRGLKKAEIYLARLLSPDKLPTLGYREEAPEDVSPIRAHAADFQQAEKGDIYVVLGHNWNTPAVMDLARMFRNRGGHAVQIIHDLIAAKAPQYFTTRTASHFRAFLDDCAKNFTAFVCVSENTRTDLSTYLGDKAGAYHIDTLRLAHTFNDTSRNQVCNEPDNKALTSLRGAPYVLCVGTIEPRKNGIALLDAWKRLHVSMGDKTPTLVFAGKIGWKTELFTQRLQDCLKHKIPVRVINSASDKDLHYLYSHCQFSVYPSLYEGWGLPVGESAWLGKTCIASNASSIPEVCGDAIEYFDATSRDDVYARIEHMCKNDAHRHEMEERIRQTPLRNWSDVARDLHDLLQGLSMNAEVKRASAR